MSPTSSRIQRTLDTARTLVRVVAPLAIILLATTWPISRFQDHAHWADVEWVPFSQYFKLFDIVANVLLFVPFGMALAWRGDGRLVRRAALVGLALALTVELSQVFTHNRIATMTDVVTNTTGAWMGAWLATRRRDESDPSALPAQDGDELRAS